jgi:hypothetical protein
VFLRRSESHRLIALDLREPVGDEIQNDEADDGKDGCHGLIFFVINFFVVFLVVVFFVLVEFVREIVVATAIAPIAAVAPFA